MNPSATIDGIKAGAIGLLTNLETSYPGFYEFIFVLCYFAGTALLILGIFMLKGLSESHNRSDSGTTIVMTFITATLLLTVPSTIEMTANTVFNNQKSILDYKNLYAENTGNPLDPVFKFVQFIGLIAYVRGLFLCKEIGKQSHNSGETFNKAVVFLLVGMMAMHVKDSLGVLATTFGISTIKTLIGV